MRDNQESSFTQYRGYSPNQNSNEGLQVAVLLGFIALGLGVFLGNLVVLILLAVFA